MKSTVLALVFGALAASLPVQAHLVTVRSPTHEQTFAYGSERHRQWMTRGPDHHLALSLQFTNDPYVDQDNPRRCDDFIFDFPDVRLGADGRTFSYHPAHGPAVAVARRHSGFLGIEEVRLLDNALLLMHSPHGLVSLDLLIDDQSAVSTAAL